MQHSNQLKDTGFTLDISIVIVNYNTAHLLQQCIDSVLMQSDIRFEIIVVDNASQDNSLSILQRYQNQIRSIASPANLGFGKANNLAATHAQGRYLFLLNPDATLQTPNDLQQLMQFMEKNSNIGLAGTKIINPNNTIESLPRTTYPGQKYLSTHFSHLPGKIAWLLGASIILSKKNYQLLKGFDEDYFLYGEDTDICYRTRQLGYAVGYCDTVTVKHIGGASELKTVPYELWQRKQKGLYLFFKKHYTPQDSKRIVRKYLKRARWRLWLLRFYKKIIRLNVSQQNKYQKYQAIYNTSKEFLAHI